MNFHQNIEDILRAATPEQKLLWNDIFLRYGERLPVAQLFYQGGHAGAEFLTYSANKLYICYSLLISGYGAPSATAPLINVYNPANAVFFVLGNARPFWDATAAAVRYMAEDRETFNFSFSRIAPQGLAYIRFIGYRVTI